MTPQGVTIRHPDKLFIGGEWVAATSGRQIAIVNPNSLSGCRMVTPLGVIGRLR